MNPEQLSRLIDADLELDSLDATLRVLSDDAGAREALTSYQMIGDALRGRVVEDDGYSRRIFAALARARIDPV